MFTYPRPVREDPGNRRTLRLADLGQEDPRSLPLSEQGSTNRNTIYVGL